ncbi:MAG: hypothetical protein JSV62_15920 [Promethearchaeota archaeon]|nr:MAG: hypothetical protein JSV62_15920 [Candidatus Lokiarchaeota archaeon]
MSSDTSLIKAQNLNVLIVNFNLLGFDNKKISEILVSSGYDHVTPDSVQVVLSSPQFQTLRELIISQSQIGAAETMTAAARIAAEILVKGLFDESISSKDKCNFALEILKINGITKKNAKLATEDVIEEVKIRRRKAIDGNNNGNSKNVTEGKSW